MHERDAFIEKSDVFCIDWGGHFGRNAFRCRSIYLPSETQA